MSVFVPEKHWWKPLGADEKIWVQICIVTAVIFFLMMPIYNVVGNQNPSHESYQEFSLGLKLSGMTFGLALICFLLAFLKLEGPPNTNFFENLFWGGGHLLQFVNTLAMLSCWILLAEYLYGESLLPPLMTKFLLISVLLAAFPGPLFYLLYPF